MFHFDPPLGEGPIEGNVLGWAIFPARFASWGRPQGVGVLLSDANIGQIADAPNALGQASQQFRLAQDRQISGWPRHTLGDITDFAGLLIDRDLAFERMLLLFAAVKAISDLAITGALDALL